MDVGDTASAISTHERILLGTDLNGHVDQGCDSASDCHGKHRYGIRKEGKKYS